MINQRYCPFCKTPAMKSCCHLALAAEGRDFVKRCVEMCHGEIAWRTLSKHQYSGDWAPELEDFTWLETAFCERFLKRLVWFGGMDYEWRSGQKLEQGGFWVLLWSKDPQRLWWELREEFEHQTSSAKLGNQEMPPWLIKLG
jgi:hypothetical protein